VIRFSVIMPCWNPDRSQMRHALRSVVTQLDASVHQVVVIDDQSTTPLDGLVGEFPGVQYVRTEKELFGLEATNLGYGMSEGDLIQVLHPDDAVVGGYYAHVAAAAERFPGRALYATSHLECDEFLRPFSAPQIDWLGDDGKTFQPLHRGNPLAVAACCLGREYVRTYGGWDTRLQHTADWIYFAKATTLGGAVSIGWPLACFRHAASSHTGRLMRTADNLRDYILAAQVAKDFMPVDEELFRKYVAMRARRQAEMFRMQKDAEAVAANEKLIAELEAAPAAEASCP